MNPNPTDLAPCCGKRWDEHLGIVGTCLELQGYLREIVELRFLLLRERLLSEARLRACDKKTATTFELMKLHEKVDYYESFIGWLGEDPNDETLIPVRAREVLNKFRFVPQEKGEGEG